MGARRYTPKHITIDFDDIDRKHLERVTFLLRLAYICNSTKCRIAETYKGYHVYIESGDYDFWRAIAVRTYLMDDEMRIEIDMKRIEQGAPHWTDTLFRCKRQKDYSYCENEIDLETLWRRWIVGWWPW